MYVFKSSAVALALAASFSASAMTAIDDPDLSQVAGQEGMSIIADLNINIGAFTYIDDGASVSFNNIGINGMLAVTIDLLTSATYQTTAVNSVMWQSGVSNADATGVVNAIGNVTGYTGQDVVQFAFPVALNVVSVKVANITTGHGGASMGGIQLNRIDLAGTKVWMYGHQ